MRAPCRFDCSLVSGISSPPGFFMSSLCCYPSSIAHMPWANTCVNGLVDDTLVANCGSLQRWSRRLLSNNAHVTREAADRHPGTGWVSDASLINASAPRAQTSSRRVASFASSMSHIMLIESAYCVCLPRLACRMLPRSVSNCV